MLPHPFSEEWPSYEGGHWHACGVCGASDGYRVHEPEADDGDPTTPPRCKDRGYVPVAAEPAQAPLFER